MVWRMPALGGNHFKMPSYLVCLITEQMKSQTTWKRIFLIHTKTSTIWRNLTVRKNAARPLLLNLAQPTTSQSHLPYFLFHFTPLYSCFSLHIDVYMYTILYIMHNNDKKVFFLEKRFTNGSNFGFRPPSIPASRAPFPKRVWMLPYGMRILHSSREKSALSI